MPKFDFGDEDMDKGMKAFLIATINDAAHKHVNDPFKEIEVGDHIPQEKQKSLTLFDVASKMAEARKEDEEGD